jgi:hypothetical protein
MSKSGAARKAKHIAKQNELGDLPLVANPLRRNKCKDSLVQFGIDYCSLILDHAPSERMREGLINKLERVIKSGGQIAIMYTRGGGKTTWMEIAIVWALLYGYRQYPVVIAAKTDLAKQILKSVWAIIERSNAIAEDFPAVSLPIRALKGVPQRALSQTYHDEPTRIETASTHFRLPMLCDESGEALEAASGATMGALGIGASVRGLLDMGSRPDLLLFDDPQTKKDALSPARVAWIESFIHSDALGLAAHTKSLAACMTITPQKYGDLAMRISDRAAHPEWNISQAPLVKWCEKAEELWPGFLEAYREDMAEDDFTCRRSRAYYIEHKEEYAQTQVLDELAYDKNFEEDAIHHALKLRAKMGDEAFAAECLLSVKDVEATLPVTFETVSHALNGYNRASAPAQMTRAVAFCDVNTRDVGLTWVVVAFGAQHTAAVVNYGRYPQQGSLVEKDASTVRKKNAISKGIVEVTNIISNMRLANTRIVALGFDRGFEADVVHKTLQVIRRRIKPPFQVCALKGSGWSNFGENKKQGKIAEGDHCYAAESLLGEYLSFHAPYWREIMLSGFLETPLMPGSLSIFGSNPTTHFDFATEVAAERLIRKYMHPSGKLAWDWATTGANHYCDALTCAFVLASWFRIYTALPASPVKAQADNPLFDPIQNPAIANSPQPKKEEILFFQPVIKRRQYVTRRK